MSCLCLLQRTSPEGGIHLNCHYCHNLFSGKPEILDWQVRTFSQGDVEVEANPTSFLLLLKAELLLCQCSEGLSCRNVPGD